jgi:hypothetical protein
MTESQDDLREAALASLKRKRSFKQFVVAYVFVNALCIAVWALTRPDGEEFWTNFWPGWVLFGMTIALVTSAWNAYGPGNRPITDSQIDEEMRKLRGE